MQATPRNARIDVEDVCHVVMNIGPSAAPCSATKERTSAEDAPGLPIGPPRGPFCAGESAARSFLRPQADAIIDVVLHAGRSGHHYRDRLQFYGRVFAAPDPGWREYGGG